MASFTPYECPLLSITKCLVLQCTYWEPCQSQFLGLIKISLPFPSFFLLDCCKEGYGNKQCGGRGGRVPLSGVTASSTSPEWVTKSKAHMPLNEEERQGSIMGKTMNLACHIQILVLLLTSHVILSYFTSLYFIFSICKMNVIITVTSWESFWVFS